MREFGIAFFLLTGSFLMLISALGVLRFPDAYTRMHAASKASSLGVSLILIGVFLELLSLSAAWKAGVAIFFIYLTAPLAAHLLSRAAYRTGARPSPLTVVDEIAEKDAL